MGWFWKDVDVAGSDLVAHHPLPNSPSAKPPPSCPMHKPDSEATSPPLMSASQQIPSACPVKHTTAESSTPSYISKLNPLNYMPKTISNSRESNTQSVHLPLERESSTIPRGDGDGTWEYPSPQQMYNAMLRKGYTNTPAEHVESMVAVHNFLNEGAWEEIREWERRFGNGLRKGWEYSVRGEENAARMAGIDELRDPEREAHEPKLLRFMGRPSDRTPKAKMLSVMAWLYPSQFPDNPPFDRHDWFVQRRLADGRQQEVRYVIDYYSGPPEPTGEPVFFLDVRPAIDTPSAACARMLRWGGDVWHRASGASVREELARHQARVA